MENEKSTADVNSGYERKIRANERYLIEITDRLQKLRTLAGEQSVPKSRAIFWTV